MLMRYTLATVLTMGIFSGTELLAHQPSCSHQGGGVPSYGGEYVENKGQWDDRVLYRADFGLVALFVEHGRLSFSKWADEVPERVHDAQQEGPEVMDNLVLRGHAWYLWFEGADPAAHLERSGMAGSYFNYFLGNDPRRWASEVRHFDEVRYRGLWPGVDLRLYDQQGMFKYDVELQSAADVGQVHFRYEGLDNLRIGPKGELVLTTSVGEVSEMAPVAWYADGSKDKVDCRFTLKDGVVGFRFGKGTDMARPVVIDPVLIASTLSGTGNIGTTQNYGHTATYDNDGNIYTGAICFGQGYPATPGAFEVTNNGGIDIAVSKLNPTGTALLYATYLGGNGGDYPHSLVVTPAGELTVFGTTNSNNYPTANAFDDSYNGGLADIVVSKLNIAGTGLVGSTYVGGGGSDGRNTFTSNYGDNYRGEVISDALGRIYVASCSDASGFPTTPGALQPNHGGGQDGVAFCLSADLSTMVWSTYFGTPAADMCYGIKLDGSGLPVVCGGTQGNSLPTTAGAFQSTNMGARDAFIAKFNSSGTSVLACSYFGGTNEDIAFFLQLDLDDNAYIYGQAPNSSWSIDPPTVYGQAGGRAFVAKFNASFTNKEFSTKLGPGTNIVPVAFLVDVCRNIYISGYSVGSGWPMAGAPLYTSGGFYLATFEPDMEDIIYGTYYTGADHVDGGTSRFDANGIVYQAVCTSGGFPTSAGAYSNVQPFSWDVGVFKIDFDVSGVNAAGISTVNQGCAPISISFTNNSSGNSWIWDFGDGSPPVEGFEPSHTYTTPGTFTVTLIAIDSLSCNLADTTYLPLTIGAPQQYVPGFTYVQTADCNVLEIVTTNTSVGDPIDFIWFMGDGTSYGSANVTHTYELPGTYTVQLIAFDPTGCTGNDTLTTTIVVDVPLQADAEFTVQTVPGCDQAQALCSVNNPNADAEYLWDMGDGTQLTGASVSHLFQGVGSYTVTLVAIYTDGCIPTDTSSQQVDVLPSEVVEAAFTAIPDTDCNNLLITTTNNSIGTNMAFLWEFSDGAQYNTVEPQHILSGAGTYTITLTVTDTLGCSPPSTISTTVEVPDLEPVLALFLAEQVGDCTQLTVAVTDQSTGPNLLQLWNMGDGTNYIGVPPNHAYPGPGTYTVTVVVTDTVCGTQDSYSLQVSLINELPVALVGVPVICPGASTTLVAEGNAQTYLWSTGSTEPSITVDVGGQYSVIITLDGCQGQASTSVIEAPDLELSYALEACPTQAVQLTVPIEGQSYAWSTGASTRDIRVIGPGEHVFTVVSPLGCTYTDTVRVIALDALPMVFAPNAFTPDGDGVNDVFRIAGFGEKTVKLSVFNRWGEELWTNEGFEPFWDGRYNGSVVQDGVYVYLLKYTGVCDAEEREVVGHVTVVR